MNDAQDHLDLLARDVVSPVPAGLLDSARSAHRRRTRGRLAVGGAVAAVAVVALAVTIPSRGGTTSRPEEPGAVAAPDIPEARSGTKWITAGGFMVAVPAEWQRTTPRCSDAAVQDEGPGFYYVDYVPDDCRTADPGSSPSVGLIPALGDSQALRCDPACSQTAVEGDVELRVRRLDSAAAVRAVVETLQPLPEDWVVDPTAGTATPYDVSVPRSRLVTDRDDVVGTWTVVHVEGGPVPPRAERRLDVFPEGRASIELNYSDGVNGIGVTVRVRADGTLVQGQTVSTTIGCSPSCSRPSGFGVMGATQLRLTPDGDLVLVGPEGTALAVYERA